MFLNDIVDLYSSNVVMYSKLKQIFTWTFRNQSRSSTSRQEIVHVCVALIVAWIYKYVVVMILLKHFPVFRSSHNAWGYVTCALITDFLWLSRQNSVWCHVTSYHLTLRHSTWHDVIPCDVTWRHTTWRDMTSYHVTWHDVIPCDVTWRHTTFLSVTSVHTISQKSKLWWIMRLFCSSFFWVWGTVDTPIEE